MGLHGICTQFPLEGDLHESCMQPPVGGHLHATPVLGGFIGLCVTSVKWVVACTVLQNCHERELNLEKENWDFAEPIRIQQDVLH